MDKHAANNLPNPTRVKLSVGFVLMPRFTLLPFSAFLDCLRLAADDGDESRQINCQWTFMTANGHDAVSSSGAVIGPCQALQPPERFDYIVVCGGLLRTGGMADSAILRYLKQAAEHKVTLVGLCTGPFVLTAAGLMNNRRCCVSWYHYQDFISRYPEAIPVADRLFVVDGNRITCSGGTAAADLAAWIIDRRIGRASSQKSLNIMLIDRPRRGNAAQPQPAGLANPVEDNYVRRAMRMIEQRLSDPIDTSELAERLGLGRRQLERRFKQALGVSPSRFCRDTRTRHGAWLLTNTTRSIAQISSECGFADGAHFARQFKTLYGQPPSDVRKTLGQLVVPPAQQTDGRHLN